MLSSIDCFLRVLSVRRNNSIYFPKHLGALRKYKITARRLFPNSYGLYFVVSKYGRVLYVGKTMQPFAKRWYGHDRYEQAKRYNAYIAFWPCKLSELRLLEEEKKAIDFYDPKWNGTKVIDYKFRDRVQKFLFLVSLFGIGVLTFLRFGA